MKTISEIKNVLTIPEAAELLGVSHWRVRHSVAKLDVAPPRAGLTRLIPAEWLPAIQDALGRDGRRDRKKNVTIPKPKRPQPKL
jgi:hypothetical protein